MTLHRVRNNLWVGVVGRWEGEMSGSSSALLVGAWCIGPAAGGRGKPVGSGHRHTYTCALSYRALGRL